MYNTSSQLDGKWRRIIALEYWFKFIGDNSKSTGYNDIYCSVTGSNGCTATDEVMVLVDISRPMASAGIDQTVSCTVLDATLTASGGGTYEWSEGSTTSQITTQISGTYIVTVTGMNGCTSTDMVSVNSIKQLR
ncbi:MAG: hypothetical protein IPO14_04565 [Saprospiraceae bacterium]|nr:hypothetical protein [Saprospiraceae bacterium]